MNLTDLLLGGTNLHRLRVKWNFRRKMIVISASIISLIYLIVVAFNILLQGPIQNHLMHESAKNVRSQIQATNIQISNLETYAYALNSTLDTSTLPQNIQQLPTSLTSLRQTSNQLFLLENDSTLITKAVLLVSSPHPYIINSSGTSRNSVAHYQTVIPRHLNSHRWRQVNGHLYLLQPIGGTRTSMTLIIEISVTKLIKRYTPSVGHNNSALIIGDHTPLGMNIHQLLPLKNNDIIFYRQRRYRVSKRQASHLGEIWTYYSFTSLSNIFNEISEASIWIIVISFLTLMGITAIIFWFRHNFFTPVQNLMDLAGTPSDEVNALQAQWEKLLKQQATETLTTEENRERLQTNFLTQMIEGRFAYLKPDELKAKATEQGLELTSAEPAYFIRIQLAATISPTSHHVTDDPNLANFLFNNIVSDLAQKSFGTAYNVASQDIGITLLTRTADTNMIHQFYKQITTNLNHLLAKYVTVIISDPITEWQTLSKHAEAINNAISFQRLLVDNQEIFLSELDSKTFNQPKQFSDIAENQLLDALRNLEPDSLQDDLNQFLSTFFDEKQVQGMLIDSIEKLYFDTRQLIQNIGVTTSFMISERALLHQARTCFRQPELANLINAELLQPTLHLLQNYRRQDAQGKIQYIVDYLKANFSDANLSLEQVAEHFELDSYTLSKTFKAKTSSTFTDYLTSLRVTYAKQELRTSTKLINIIATESGYQPSYFNRIFKKQVGITPGQYRKQS